MESLVFTGPKAMNNERKIGASSSSDILKAIRPLGGTMINSPILSFLRRGDSTSKLESIAKYKVSDYGLSRGAPSSVHQHCCYGWGMGQQDTHILKQLCAQSQSEWAVSVYCQGRSVNSLKQEMEKIQERLSHFKSIKRLDFFDASSPLDCWLHK